MINARAETAAEKPLCAPLHDRMPVILGTADYDRWLDPALNDAAELQPLLGPYPADEMLAEPVSTHVNNVRNNDENCIAVQQQMF